MNTAIFSLVNAMLFAPPAYQRPNEIVQLFSQNTKNPKTFPGVFLPDSIATSRSRTPSSPDCSRTALAVIGLGEKGNTRRAFGDIVSANYFSVLGVAPARGPGLFA